MSEPRALLCEILGTARAAALEPGGVGVGDPRLWSITDSARQCAGPATHPGQDQVPNVCAQYQAAPVFFPPPSHIWRKGRPPDPSSRLEQESTWLSKRSWQGVGPWTPRPQLGSEAMLCGFLYPCPNEKPLLPESPVPRCLAGLPRGSESSSKLRAFCTGVWDPRRGGEARGGVYEGGVGLPRKGDFHLLGPPY
jgi:hypothetical protein